ncbi:MAG: FAD-dependent oxidoreductase [Myxococcota bacterium]
MSGPACKQVVVLGAGQAGLAAAYRAARRGIAVSVLEGRDTVGGIGSSFELDGIQVDYGSHRFNAECDPEVLADLYELLGDELLTRPKNSRLRLRGRWIHFPMGPGDLLRLPGGFALGFAADLARAGLRRVVRRGPEREADFPELLESDLGRTLCRDFYFPYARKTWGLPPEQLSVPPAQRHRSGNLLGNALRNGASALLGRKPPGADRFLYPRGGFGQIGQRYYEAAREAGAKFTLGARVKCVERDDTRVRGVRYESDGREHSIEAECVWSTLPLTLLARCMEPAAPPEVLDAVAGLSFRGVILIYLVLEQDRFSDYDTHFIPDAEIPLTRLSEPKNYSGAVEPRGRTVLCAELPCDPDAPEFELSDEELGRLALRCLDAAGLPVRAPLRGVVTRRLRRAYPVYRVGSDVHLARIDQWLRRFEGLVSFGLQGLFAHDDSHHILHMAYSAVDSIGPDGRFDWERWQASRRLFEARVAQFLRTMNGISI